MLLAGLAVFLAAADLPTRKVRVEGNVRHAHPASSGRRGRKRHPLRRFRRAVRRRNENALLSALPQLQWAGGEHRMWPPFPCGADRPGGDGAGFGGEQHRRVTDGFIVSVTVTRGNFCVAWAVSEGRAGSDLALTAASAFRRPAEGEIYAQTSRDFTAVTPAQWTVRGSRLSGENTASSSETHKFMERQWNFAGQL